jgi:L-histidine Nalpha-methyltransferase / hercynylcysteine S-oxide synthase
MEFFVDLEKANVGFKHWHPMPVTQNGNKLAGLSDMGGLWEWTSSTLERIEGFKPMKLYPAYSGIFAPPATFLISGTDSSTDDFYDGKHNVVLGGSWATHPRVAGRKTL